MLEFCWWWFACLLETRIFFRVRLAADNKSVICWSDLEAERGKCAKGWLAMVQTFGQWKQMHHQTQAKAEISPLRSIRWVQCRRKQKRDKHKVRRIVSHFPFWHYHLPATIGSHYFQRPLITKKSGASVIEVWHCKYIQVFCSWLYILEKLN